MKLLNMRAAFYGRRSTDEHQMASMQVQLAEGERYIVAQGGALAREHVYLDDAISRAEFKKRPGLIALLNAAKAGAFDAVVVRDESRLGGDTFRSGLVIQDIIESGVRMFYYYTNEEVMLDGAVNKFMIAARSFAAELEREKTSQRTHEHLLTKARRGLVVGGRVYGYDNVEVKSGDRRVHVEYKINDEQAAVVREIFARYARGEGLRMLAKDLNGRRVPSPRAGKRGTGSWSTSVIWSMLRRERYRGVLVWNRREKTYRGGTKVRLRRDESEWVRAEAPHLRIVDDELWTAANAKTKPVDDAEQDKRRGRPPRHMLSGLARCGQCGGPMTVTNGKSRGETIKGYTCSYSRDRGKTVCTNMVRRPVDAVNEAVVEWIAASVIDEELLLEALGHLRKEHPARMRATDSEMPRAEKEAARLRAELERLVAVLANSDKPPEAIVRGIEERQEHLAGLEGRLQAAKAAHDGYTVEPASIEQEARRRLQDLRGLFSRNPEAARHVVEVVFANPISVTPRETAEGKRFELTGTAPIGRMHAMDRGRPR